MKNIFVKIGSLIVLMLAVIISAEAQNAKTHRAHIPFDFSVGSKTFVAGDYIIEQANPSADSNSIIIRNAATNATKFFQVIKLSNEEFLSISKLVFDRYEDKYVLAEMITPALSTKFFQPKQVKIFIAKNNPVRATVKMN